MEGGVRDEGGVDDAYVLSVNGYEGRSRSIQGVWNEILTGVVDANEEGE